MGTSEPRAATVDSIDPAPRLVMRRICLLYTSPGAGATAPWAPGLVEAMTAHNVAIHEEQVLDDLLADLVEGERQN